MTLAAAPQAKNVLPVDPIPEEQKLAPNFGLVAQCIQAMKGDETFLPMPEDQAVTIFGEITVTRALRRMNLQAMVTQAPVSAES